MDTLKRLIRHVPDFPKPGILFYDVTTLLQNPDGFKQAIDAMAGAFLSARIDRVVGVESRGFIFGAAVADRLGAGFVPVRKPGKLPSRTRSESYTLEYGTDALELHEDGVVSDHRVLIIDDLLATGGTAGATVRLVRAAGADVVALQFLIELVDLGGRAKLEGERVETVLRY